MQNVLFIIYQITNQIDGKIYIGKHETSNIEDGYMGSGKYLKRAISKYGFENFKKEILFVFDNEQDMNDKEKELVTEKFVNRKDTYNLCPGGKGGFGYINANGLRGPGATHKQLNSKRARKLAQQRMLEYNTNLTPEERIKKNKNLWDWTRRNHTEETKRKMCEVKKGHGIGEQNSQYGTMWITNGSKNQKIQKSDPLPDKWWKGYTTQPPKFHKLKLCQSCYRKQEVEYWCKQFIESDAPSIRAFLRNNNCPYGITPFSNLLKEGGFILQKSIKFSSQTARKQMET